MKRILKFSISLVFFAAWTLHSRVLQLLGRKPPGRCVVLYYHEVPPLGNRFARQMDELVRLVQAIPADFAGQLVNGRRYAAVTFCDGFQCFLENAVPELVKRNIPATVFVPTGFIGCRPDWMHDSSCESLCRRTVLTGEQIRQLPFPLITVGSHGVLHRDLRFLDEREAESELMESKRDLEKVTGRDTKLLYFPYGESSDTLLRLARKNGYERVFVNTPKLAVGKVPDFVSGSVCADPGDWNLEFRLKLMGAYCWLPFAISVKRRLYRFAHNLSFFVQRSISVGRERACM